MITCVCAMHVWICNCTSMGKCRRKLIYTYSTHIRIYIYCIYKYYMNAYVYTYYKATSMHYMNIWMDKTSTHTRQSLWKLLNKSCPQSWDRTRTSPVDRKNQSQQELFFKEPLGSPGFTKYPTKHLTNPGDHSYLEVTFVPNTLGACQLCYPFPPFPGAQTSTGPWEGWSTESFDGWNFPSLQV